MSKLSYGGRQGLPDSAFAVVHKRPDGSKERKYPIHDKTHGRNALARVSAFGTSEEKKEVRSRVCHRYPDISSCRRPRYD